MIIGRTASGMQYAVRRSGRAVAWCALSIKCGTRDEEGFHQGIAHFTEHTIFKGTVQRSARNIGSCLDRLGGELNAYTAKEEIVLHATVLKEDLPKAAGLLLELATRSTFPEKEVATERGVVIEEIKSYKDSPADDVYDCFESELFSGHPLGGQILGTVQSVKKIGSDELRRFTGSGFVPSRMALTVVADMDERAMERLVHRLSDKYLVPSCDTEWKRTLRRPSVCIFDKTVDRRHHEANAVIGAEAPSLFEERERLAAVLLANILGGPGSNSLLNAELREKHGWVYGVECSYTQYSDTGIMAISLGCEKENLERCLAAVGRVTERMKGNLMSPARLRAAKKQLLGQLAISSDGGETQCLSMGKSLLAFGRVNTPEEDRASIEDIAAGEVMDMACRIFGEGKVSRLIFL